MPRPKSPETKAPARIRITSLEATFNAPWLEIVPRKADAAALHALRLGEAKPDQQVRALEFILETICDRNGMSFRTGPDGSRETDFAEGRRFVGNQIVRLTKIPLSKLSKD